MAIKKSIIREGKNKIIVSQTRKEDNMSYEKVEIVLDLIKNMTEEEWNIIKTVVDSNFMLIKTMTNDLENVLLIRNHIKKELLSKKN